MEFTEQELDLIRRALESYLDEIFHVEDAHLKAEARALLDRIVKGEIEVAEEAAEASSGAGEAKAEV